MSIRTQGTNLFTAILILVACAVVMQLWLLTVSMHAFLTRQTGTMVPAAIGSSVLLLINSGLLRYVFRFDHETQRSPEE
jgi:hypothetical protein